MNDFLLEDGEEALREIMTPEGRVIREALLPNPYTGEIHRIATVNETRYDPETEAPETITSELVLVGIDGVALRDISEFSICGKCGSPVSRTHSVVDPFCGRILCLMHSQMIEWDGMVLRVCADCARAIKKAKRWQAIKSFLLKRGS